MYISSMESAICNVRYPAATKPDGGTWGSVPLNDFACPCLLMTLIIWYLIYCLLATGHSSALLGSIVVKILPGGKTPDLLCHW